jgi:cytoskeleton protein RodZ
MLVNEKYNINYFMVDETMNKKDFLGLRTIREEQGLTLRDIFRRSRVSMMYLEAIENGDFDHLPVPIYTRNFIKSYALALNIDSKPIIDSYDSYLAALQVSAIKTSDTVPEKEDFFKRASHFKGYIWTVAVVIVVLVVALLFSQQFKPSPELKAGQLIKTTPALVEDKTLQPNPEAKPTAAATVPEQKNNIPLARSDADKQLNVPAKELAVTQKNAATPKPLPEKKGFIAVNTPQLASGLTAEPGILMIRASEETWLRITIDQNQPSQILLKPGEKIERKGSIFEMDIGNAGGIKMQFRGKNIENLGKSGEVIHLRLP